MFSRKPLTDETLNSIFSHIEYKFVKEWKGILLIYTLMEAYPNLAVTDEFPPIILNTDGKKDLFYANAMEFAFSTMETEALSGRNIALLLSQ